MRPILSYQKYRTSRAAAEVSKTTNLWESSVVVNHGWQSEYPDGPKGGYSFLEVVAMDEVVTWT